MGQYASGRQREPYAKGEIGSRGIGSGAMAAGAIGSGSHTQAASIGIIVQICTPVVTRFVPAYFVTIAMCHYWSEYDIPKMSHLLLLKNHFQLFVASCFISCYLGNKSSFFLPTICRAMVLRCLSCWLPSLWSFQTTSNKIKDHLSFLLKLYAISFRT